jgi:hypothetical protein
MEVLPYGFQLCHIIKCRDEIMNEIIFLVDSFISQFPILATAFKCYKVYWPNDQNEICDETKSLTIFHTISKILKMSWTGFISIKLIHLFLHKYSVIS